MANCEDGRGHIPRHVGALEAGKDKKADSSLESHEGTQPCQHLDFNPVKHLGISEL